MGKKREAMISRFAVPFLILAVVFLPLPFVLALFLCAVSLSVRPRGEPAFAGSPVARPAGLPLLRSPPR
ncbi:MAG: hypothetical protein KA243_02895 [Candidatus Aminicenantes bacterium]|nr:hypothetical protein [Candidatus Aminicenantes bacterium]NLH77641.1 hypothetical protein [Acidobacteriota bacterium]